ncbi:sigma-54 interaction domain-containing protein [Acidobacteriota bacterium]
MPGKKKGCLQADLSSDWFETILCSLNEGVFCVDEEWRIFCFNLAAQAITGVPREQALGKHCWEVFRSNICEGACALRYTIETCNSLTNLAAFIVNSKGNKIPVSITTALLKDKQGRFAGGVETFRDLSTVEDLRKELNGCYSFKDIISKNPKMQALFDMIPIIAESESTVLITGESGTGKDLVARAVHNLSSRKDRSFIPVNCAAIPDTLLESELFGYRAGAFTGAQGDKPGRICLARGGTIFLDEIGDIPPAIQVKLLRLIQEKAYEPLGGIQSISADVRIVAATNRDLDKMIEKERFRLDLYYRINVIRLELPPLRNRMEDVPILVDHFIARFCRSKGKDIVGLSPESMGILMRHKYPGNVRELENIIEHSFVLCPGGIIQTHHLPEDLQANDAPPASEVAELVDQYEKSLILSALQKNRWNRLKTALELGMHKTTLYRKIKKFNILPPPKGDR